METEGRAAQSLPRGVPIAFAERPRGQGLQDPGLGEEGTVPKDRDLTVRLSPAGLLTITSDRSGQRAAIRRAGAELQPPPETAPSRRPQPQTPT